MVSSRNTTVSSHILAKRIKKKKKATEQKVAGIHGTELTEVVGTALQCSTVILNPTPARFKWENTIAKWDGPSCL